MSKAECCSSLRSTERRTALITIQRYRKTRFWAVYDAGELVCVTVYKKGANAVKERLERSDATAANA